MYRVFAILNVKNGSHVSSEKIWQSRKHNKSDCRNKNSIHHKILRVDINSLFMTISGGVSSRFTYNLDCAENPTLSGF